MYWLKKLVNLKMKEGTSISSHLNELNSIYGKLVAQEVEFKESMKVLFLLITLPDSWDTFCTTVSTNKAADGLFSVTVEASLLTKEVNIRTMRPQRMAVHW